MERSEEVGKVCSVGFPDNSQNFECKALKEFKSQECLKQNQVWYVL